MADAKLSRAQISIQALVFGLPLSPKKGENHPKWVVDPRMKEYRRKIDTFQVETLERKDVSDFSQNFFSFEPAERKPASKSLQSIALKSYQLDPP